MTEIQVSGEDLDRAADIVMEQDFHHGWCGCKDFEAGVFAGLKLTKEKHVTEPTPEPESSPTVPVSTIRLLDGSNNVIREINNVTGWGIQGANWLYLTRYISEGEKYQEGAIRIPDTIARIVKV